MLVRKPSGVEEEIA